MDIKSFPQELVVNKQQEYLKPISKKSFKKLYDTNKNTQIPLEQVINIEVGGRDVIAYTLNRNFSAVLQRLSIALARHDHQSSLQSAFDTVIVEINKEELFFTPQQMALLNQVKDQFIDSTNRYNNVQSQYSARKLKARLGPELNGLPDSSYIIDFNRFPGVAVVTFSDSDNYGQVVARKETGGVYRAELGEGLLKGRILLINEAVPISEAAVHEYQHFLFNQTKKMLAQDLSLGYQNPECVKAFSRFKDKFAAYAQGHRASSFEVYFGDTMKDIKDIGEAQIFRAEANLLKNTLELAYSKGISQKELGFLLLGATDFKQMIKFVYLHISAHTQKLE